MTERPNPGSPQAFALGCRCPVIDNHHGAGVLDWTTGKARFWVAEECPLHGERSRQEAPQREMPKEDR